MTKNQIIVCKIGGAALIDFSIMEKVAELILQYHRFGQKVVLVHGGGPHINEALKAQNIQWQFVDGLRVTTPQMMQVIEDTLQNQVQPKLMQYLSAKGIWTLGLKPQENILNCEVLKSELGLVGQVKSVNIQPLLKILTSTNKNPVVPVISSVGLLAESIHGISTCNINADEVASSIACALHADRLIFITDQKGVLGQDQQVLSLLNDRQIIELIDKDVVTGGMKTKMRQVLKALEAEVPNVQIIHSQCIEKSVWSDWLGTYCVRQQENGYVLQ